MMRTPFSEFLSNMLAAKNAQNQNQSTDGAPNPLQPDYAQLLRAAFPHQYLQVPAVPSQIEQPKVEVKPEVEPEPVPSPSDSVDRAESPASTTESLPKEAENGSRKRPAAIQELLMSKRARLSKTTTPTPANSVCDGSSTSAPSPIPESTATAIAIKSEPLPTCDDTESTSGSHTSTDASTPPPPPATQQANDAMNMFYALQRQLMQNQAMSQQDQSLSDSGLSEQKHLIPVPDSQVFTQVPSRLTLLSQVIKYNMTVGEVRRRIEGPEAFNFSLLGALLRRAKLPTKSNQLVEELANVGLSIVRGRRRAAVTLFSGLTEDESIKIASDFAQINEQAFPVKPIADKVLKDSLTAQVNAVGIQNAGAVALERRRQLEIVRNHIREFVQILNMDRSPVCDKSPEPILEENIQDPLNNYSMLTHGFGTPAMLATMNAFSSFINHQYEKLSVPNSNN